MDSKVIYTAVGANVDPLDYDDDEWDKVAMCDCQQQIYFPSHNDNKGYRGQSTARPDMHGRRNPSTDDYMQTTRKPKVNYFGDLDFSKLGIDPYGHWIKPGGRPTPLVEGPSAPIAELS